MNEYDDSPFVSGISCLSLSTLPKKIVIQVIVEEDEEREEVRSEGGRMKGAGGAFRQAPSRNIHCVISLAVYFSIWQQNVRDKICFSVLVWRIKARVGPLLKVLKRGVPRGAQSMTHERGRGDALVVTT